MGRARREARLYVCGNGQGSPCLDLRRVPDTLADATVGADLVVVEGMGRAIHTNYRRAAPCCCLTLPCACRPTLCRSSRLPACAPPVPCPHMGAHG